VDGYSKDRERYYCRGTREKAKFHCSDAAEDGRRPKTSVGSEEAATESRVVIRTNEHGMDVGLGC
jgi:hypothetical protein